MSFTLKDIKGAVVDKFSGRPVECGQLTFIEGKTRGFNEAIEAQSSVKLRFNREKLAFKIYEITMRNLASKEEIKSNFGRHYITWNPTVNESWIKADAIIAAEKEIVEVDNETTKEEK